MEYYDSPSVAPANVPAQFRAMSLAFLEAAERLTDQLKSGDWEPNYRRGEVAMWLAFHATELFLKGCIRQARPNFTKNIHSLGELLLKFEECYPDLKFQLPFGPEPILPDWEAMEWALEFDKSLHQQMRYPVGSDNSLWSPNRSFQPAIFAGTLRELRTAFEQVGGAVFGAS